MSNNFNISRYRELREKETAFNNQGTSLFYQNRSEFLELLGYQKEFSNLTDQISKLYFEVNEVGGSSEEKFYSLVANISVQLQECFNDGFYDYTYDYTYTYSYD